VWELNAKGSRKFKSGKLCNVYAHRQWLRGQIIMFLCELPWFMVLFASFAWSVSSPEFEKWPNSVSVCGLHEQIKTISLFSFINPFSNWSCVETYCMSCRSRFDPRIATWFWYVQHEDIMHWVIIFLPWPCTVLWWPGMLTTAKKGIWGVGGNTTANLLC
jgi:hypothetical protein